MGYGDALMISALAYNIKREQPAAKVAVAYLSSKYSGMTESDIDETMVYRGNPNVDKVVVGTRWTCLRRRLFGDLRGHVLVNARHMTDSYKTKVAKDKVRHLQGMHAIANMCRLQGLASRELKPEIFLTRQEQEKVDRLLQKFSLEPGRFLVVETETKKGFSNKRWFPENWAALFRELNAKHPWLKLVRISPAETPFPEVVDIFGRTNFREAARFLERSLAFVGPEGGLGHLSAAIGARAVILHSGYDPAGLTAYPTETTLHQRVECSECGWLRDCPNGRECMRRITPEQVLAAIERIVAERT